MLDNEDKYVIKHCKLCNRTILIGLINVRHLLKIDGNYYCDTCQQHRIITSASNDTIEKAIEEIKNSNNYIDEF